MPSGYIERILKARIYDLVEETPLEAAPRLSARLGNEVWIKREDMHPVFSFKIRGAYNKLLTLTEAERGRGVITASAGNHAQGVALGASKLGVQATIVMPTTTPAIKVDAVRSFGAKVVLEGDTYDEAYVEAIRRRDAEELTYLHAFDDPDVIAGQGTIGMEILRQATRPPHAIFVPVGGGGIIAGIGAYVKYLHPEVKVIGVEPEDAACLAAALRANTRVKLDQVGIFADGVAVRQIGEETFRVAKECVDEVVTVDTDEICAAIRDIFEDNRSVAEPAGALAIAGLKRYAEENDLEGKILCAIESGANMNFDRLRHVAERAELGEHREALFAVTIPERRGSFQEFCATLGKVPVTEFNYRYHQSDAAHIFLGVGLGSERGAKQELAGRLEDAGYPIVDLSDDEMAKVHVRFMVGGRASDLDDEMLYRFEFPERPGALMQFLNAMGERWNISLFHYRNHGAAWGRVLVGIQVPSGDAIAFEHFLRDLGYAAKNETDNPTYRFFLR